MATLAIKESHEIVKYDGSDLDIKLEKGDRFSTKMTIKNGFFTYCFDKIGLSHEGAVLDFMGELFDKTKDSRQNNFSINDEKSQSTQKVKKIYTMNVTKEELKQYISVLDDYAKCRVFGNLAIILAIAFIILAFTKTEKNTDGSSKIINVDYIGAAGGVAFFAILCQIGCLSRHDIIKKLRVKST